VGLPTFPNLVAPFVGMKAICRSLNLNFRIETSRPRTQSVTGACIPASLYLKRNSPGR